MKRVLSLLMMVVLLLGLLTACGGGKGNNQDASANAGKQEATNVAILLNGNRGDKAFFDSAANAANMMESLGCNTKVVEMTYDETKWLPTLIEFSADEDYDIIVVGTWQMAEKLETVAPDYPQKKYILFDSSVDYDLDGMENVYSIEYMQNECSFLAGAVAAFTSESDVIGFVGGMENYVVNDFLLGFIQGATYVKSDIKINIAYVGNFNDNAAAKELALAQINQGTDVIYQVASTAGLGVIDACAENNVWCIGVDSDQAIAFLETDPKKAEVIVTSALKLVDESIFRTVKLDVEGGLKYGQRVVMGLADGCVGIADNDIYQQNTSEETRAKIKELTDGILDGSIKVDTAFGKTTDEIESIKASVK